MPPSATLYPSVLSIDHTALAQNTRWVKARCGAAQLMAVVKANAYGHGAVAVARTALNHGASWLAVANLPEALELRQAGIAAPLLLLNTVPVAQIPLLLEHDLRVTVFDAGWARQAYALASQQSTPLKLHLKVDSGMGRLGLLPEQVPMLCALIHSLPALQLEGIFTHFSCADSDPAYTSLQLSRFERLLHDLQRAGIAFDCVHAANSAAILTTPASLFTHARPGLMLYGMNPLGSAPLPGLQPVMAWRCAISQVKTLPPGATVGYGNRFRCQREERIAVLPVGYADGLRRTPHTWREVLVHGQRAPILGTVNMEKTTIQVTHIPHVQAGDKVTLLGRQGSAEISAQEIADWLGTVQYEVLTSIAPRSPRRDICLT